MPLCDAQWSDSLESCPNDPDQIHHCTILIAADDPHAGDHRCDCRAEAGPDEVNL